MRQPEFEAISPEELELLQLERLQSTLTRAYRQVKFYRRRFDEAGLTPGSIQGLADLARLPLTTRGDLSENYPYGLFALPLKDIVRIISSPGTTDRPLVVGYSSQDVRLWLELLARLYTAAGVTPEDIVQLVIPPGLANWRLGTHGRARYLGPRSSRKVISEFRQDSWSCGMTRPRSWSPPRPWPATSSPSWTAWASPPPS